MKKVIIRLIFISAFLSSSSFAEEFDTTRDEFSDKYMAGPHLVFDCKDKHWVCVDDDNKKDCLDGREGRVKDKFRNYHCTYARSFEDKPSCFEFQKKMVNSGNNPEWSCTIDKWRIKDIKFE